MITDLSVVPDALRQDVPDVAAISRTINQANTVATPATTTVKPAGADEVSVAVATLFGVVGQQYRALVQLAATFQTQFGEALGAAEWAYTNEEYNATHLMDFNDQWIEAIEFF